MADTKKSKGKKSSLEDTFTALSKVLEQLERDDVELDKSLQAFENGIELVREAQSLLAEAEQKVQLLTSENGEISQTDLSVSGKDE